MFEKKNTQLVLLTKKREFVSVCPEFPDTCSVVTALDFCGIYLQSPMKIEKQLLNFTELVILDLGIFLMD